MSTADSPLPDLAQLPEWAREALNRSMQATATPRLDPDVVSSRSSWPLLLDAAVVSAFLPRDLAPDALTGTARGDAEKQVLGFAEIGRAHV